MTATGHRFTAVVLAAGRPDDPLARARGVRHKSLVPVAGVPMAARVIEALEHSPAIAGIAVSTDDAAALGEVPVIARLMAAGRLRTVAAAPSPSQSVLAAAEALAGGFPILVTTSDHALLTPAMIEHFCAEAALSGADIAAGVAEAAVVRAVRPGGRRTFLGFRDRRVSGCNLFALMTPAALDAVRLWRRVEAHRKHPWRMAAALGPATIVLYLLRLLTLDGAMARLSRLAGARAAAVIMPFGKAAIDVDTPEDLEFVEGILEQIQIIETP